jgi:hypothetical protein
MNTVTPEVEIDRDVASADRSADRLIAAGLALGHSHEQISNAAVVAFAEVNAATIGEHGSKRQLAGCPSWCDDPDPVKPDAKRHAHYSAESGGYIPCLLSVEVDGLTTNVEKTGVPLVAASAFRPESGVQPDGVHLHVTGGGFDVGPVLLPYHARLLAAQLIEAAALADGAR